MFNTFIWNIITIKILALKYINEKNSLLYKLYNNIEKLMNQIKESKQITKNIKIYRWGKKNDRIKDKENVKK